MNPTGLHMQAFGTGLAHDISLPPNHWPSGFPSGVFPRKVCSISVQNLYPRSLGPRSIRGLWHYAMYFQDDRTEHLGWIEEFPSLDQGGPHPSPYLSNFKHVRVGGL